MTKHGHFYEKNGTSDIELLDKLSIDYKLFYQIS